MKEEEKNIPRISWRAYGVGSSFQSCVSFIHSTNTYLAPELTTPFMSKNVHSFNTHCVPDKDVQMATAFPEITVRWRPAPFLARGLCLGEGCETCRMKRFAEQGAFQAEDAASATACRERAGCV